MNEVLRVLVAGGNEEDALKRSFEDAAEGFGAANALLLLVEDREHLRLRSICVRGLTAQQVRACERGESVKGVSSSIIRAVIANRRLMLIRAPLAEGDPAATPALAGADLSVLCAPVVDTVRDIVLAVMYFQNNAPDHDHAYHRSDTIWLEGYASALSRAFALYFQEQRRERELEELLRKEARPENAPELIGDSAHTQALRRVLHEVYIPATEAPDPEPLLILGEKGTGKDLVARYVHAYSARRDRPYVVVNCAEITDELAVARFFGHRKGSFTGAMSSEPGFFRSAHQGVLFLDEIAELSFRAQATLLRVLENRTVVPVGETKEQRVDVQVILATNHDIERAVAEGLIRQDFLDRFKTQVIRLEPLRDRPWDIPALVQHFLAHHERRTRKKTLGLTQEALRAMVSYAWPGNVRELARVCSLVISHATEGRQVDRSLLSRCYPDLVSAGRTPKGASVLWEGAPMREAVRAFERELILTRLERHNWKLRAARESLRLPKTTFLRQMRRYGISVPRSRGEKVER
jgi:transcriptional regulator with GAF, ATPase, and Fis domain